LDGALGCDRTLSQLGYGLGHHLTVRINHHYDLRGELKDRSGQMTQTEIQCVPLTPLFRLPTFNDHCTSGSGKFSGRIGAIIGHHDQTILGFDLRQQLR
jgi:hypothetical protein